MSRISNKDKRFNELYELRKKIKDKILFNEQANIILNTVVDKNQKEIRDLWAQMNEIEPELLNLTGERDYNADVLAEKLLINKK